MDFAFPDLSKSAGLSSSSRAGENVGQAAASATAPQPRLPLTAYSTVTHAGPSRSNKSLPTTAAEGTKASSDKAGQSQIDYLRLISSEGAEPSQPLRRDIPLSELQSHGTARDAWICLKGKVYDVTTYLQVSSRRGMMAAERRRTSLDYSDVDVDY